jgi:hypothetical protein
MTHLKRCPRCKERKLKALFYNNKTTTDKCSGYCKSCHGEVTTQSRRNARARMAKTLLPEPRQMFCTETAKWHWGRILFQIHDKHGNLLGQRMERVGANHTRPEATT